MVLSDVELAVDSLDEPDSASPPHVYLNCVLSFSMHLLYYIKSCFKNNNGLQSVKTRTTAISRYTSTTCRGIYPCTRQRRQRHSPPFLKWTDLSTDPWIRWETLCRERQVMCPTVLPYNQQQVSGFQRQIVPPFAALQKHVLILPWLYGNLKICPKSRLNCDSLRITD